MAEIKLHPWYAQDLPLYLKNITQYSLQQAAVDEDIVKKLFNVRN
jgi:hypothetical protein